jgi:hypothetical protein
LGNRFFDLVEEPSSVTGMTVPALNRIEHARAERLRQSTRRGALAGRRLMVPLV